MHLQLWQLAAIVCAAYGIGLAKTGITGIGIVSVALFAFALGPASVGVVLPLLIFTDCIAVFTYHRHAVWSHLWRLFPWAVVGIVLGWLAMRRIEAHQVGHLIGLLLLLLILVQIVQRVQTARRRGESQEEAPEEMPVRMIAN